MLLLLIFGSAWCHSSTAPSAAKQPPQVAYCMHLGASCLLLLHCQGSASGSRNTVWPDSTSDVLAVHSIPSPHVTQNRPLASPAPSFLQCNLLKAGHGCTEPSTGHRPSFCSRSPPTRTPQLPGARLRCLPAAALPRLQLSGIENAYGHAQVSRVQGMQARDGELLQAVKQPLL
jgi:hypothetical protein